MKKLSILLLAGLCWLTPAPKAAPADPQAREIPAHLTNASSTALALESLQRQSPNSILTRMGVGAFEMDASPLPEPAHDLAPHLSPSTIRSIAEHVGFPFDPDSLLTLKLRVRVSGVIFERWTQRGDDESTKSNEKQYVVTGFHVTASLVHPGFVISSDGSVTPVTATVAAASRTGEAAVDGASDALEEAIMRCVRDLHLRSARSSEPQDAIAAPPPNGSSLATAAKPFEKCFTEAAPCPSVSALRSNPLKGVSLAAEPDLTYPGRIPVTLMNLALGNGEPAPLPREVWAMALKREGVPIDARRGAVRVRQEVTVVTPSDQRVRGDVFWIWDHVSISHFAVLLPTRKGFEQVEAQVFSDVHHWASQEDTYAQVIHAVRSGASTVAKAFGAEWLDASLRPEDDVVQATIFRELRERTEERQAEMSKAIVTYLEPRGPCPLPLEVTRTYADWLAKLIDDGIPQAAATIGDWYVDTPRGRTLNLWRLESASISGSAAAKKVRDQIVQGDRLMFDFFATTLPTGPSMLRFAPEYVDRLARGRTYGKGAIVRELLVPADKALWYEAMGAFSAYRSEEERLSEDAASNWNKRHRTTLRRALILDVLYQDEGATAERRFFWYGARPEGWKEMFDELPSGLRLAAQLNSEPVLRAFDREVDATAHLRKGLLEREGQDGWVLALELEQGLKALRENPRGLPPDRGYRLFQHLHTFLPPDGIHTPIPPWLTPYIEAGVAADIPIARVMRAEAGVKREGRNLVASKSSVVMADLESAAAADEPHAWAYLGLWTLQGDLPGGRTRAFELFERGADRNPECVAQLIWLIRSGYKLPEGDPRSSPDWQWLAAVRASDESPTAAFLVAELRTEKLLRPREKQTRFAGEYQEAARAGSWQAREWCAQNGISYE